MNVGLEYGEEDYTLTFMEEESVACGSSRKERRLMSW